MEPLVSIIMPNYNGGAYIGDTIKSVLAQTYSNFEFIIVDDASTDASRDIINSFEDERIKLICKSRNEQICMALNTGIKNAKGSYIARIDSDDKWKPEKLKKQVEFLEKYSEYGACFTWADIIDQDDNKISGSGNLFYSLFRQENRTREEWIRRLFFEGNCLCHPSVVVRSELMAKLNGYRNSLLQLQDYDIWLRLLRISSIYVLEEELTEYRRIDKDNQSISAKCEENDTRCYNETVYIMEDYLEDMDNELFISCFRDNFVNRDSKTEQELSCEKAFLLCSAKEELVGRENGIKRLAGLLDESSSGAVLQEKFNFTLKDFYNLNKRHYYFDYILRDNNNINISAEPAVYYRSGSEDDSLIQVSRKVNINGGILKCSFDIPEDARNIRFDPVDNKVCIISEFKAVSGGKELKCTPVNGQLADNVWIFATKDPQINVAGYDGFDGKIEIEAKIFLSNSDTFINSVKAIEEQIVKNRVLEENNKAKISALESQTVNYKDMIDAKDNHIFNLENIIAAKDADLNAKAQHIQNLEQTIEEMEGTKVWKLYRRIKKN